MASENRLQLPPIIRKHPAVEEILENENFLSMRDYLHHGNINCLQHTLQVAARAYYMTRIRPGIDVISTVRAALLHDFYLYDWHTDSPGLHGLKHPTIALANAQKLFTLNEIERDAIKRHMWPLTPFPPRFRESYIVTFADKLVTWGDYSGMMEPYKEKLNPRRLTGSI